MMDVLKRNNVTVSGQGDKTILFAHGFGCDQNAWRYIKDAFAGEYKIVLFDYVGAGKSDTLSYNRDRYSSLHGYATDILEICHALDLQQVVLVAHSVSCMIGALAAIKEPSLFQQLIFIGPSPCYINREGYVGGFEQEDIEALFEIMEEDYITWASMLANNIMDKENGNELVTELSESFCAIDPEIAKQFARVTFLGDNRADLQMVPVPSLTIQCSKDYIGPVSVGHYIQQHTPGNSLIILDAQGHCPHMSNPAITIKTIKDFLKK